jgi:hypothetical protein
MECETIPVSSPEKSSSGKKLANVVDEILGDGSQTPDFHPAVTEAPEKRPDEGLPTKVPPANIKYKSNRYYKPEQSAILWEFYLQNQYPSKAEQAELAMKVGGIEIKRIIWWFTHRRRMDKKKPLALPAAAAAASSSTATAAAEAPTPIVSDVNVSVGCLLSNSCDVCQFTAARRSKLLSHLKLQHGLSPASCLKCKKIWKVQDVDQHPCVKRKSPKKRKSGTNLPIQAEPGANIYKRSILRQLQSKLVLCLSQGTT